MGRGHPAEKLIHDCVVEKQIFDRKMCGVDLMGTPPPSWSARSVSRTTGVKINVGCVSAWNKGIAPIHSADGPELVDWIKKRLPIRHNVFLVYGELPALSGLQAQVNGIVDSAKIILPSIDETFELAADP